MVTAKGKKKILRGLIGATLIVGIICGSLVVIGFLTGIGYDPFDSQKIAVALPCQLTVHNARSKAVVNTGAYCDIYKGGVIAETLDSGADGTASGTKQFNTGETLVWYIHPSGYIPLTFEYVVPKEFITASYHAEGLSIELEPACNGEDVFLADRTLAEKDAASGSAWNCTPTLPTLIGYWKLVLDAEDESVGGSWWLPSNTEQYPLQYTYATIKLTDASGYADGMLIDGWSLSDDGVTWFQRLNAIVTYDSTFALTGIIWLPVVIHFPQSLDTHEVSLTAKIISQCDPQEMQVGNFAGSGLLWDNADTAVFVGMEA